MCSCNYRRWYHDSATDVKPYHHHIYRQQRCGKPVLWNYVANVCLLLGGYFWSGWLASVCWRPSTSVELLRRIQVLEMRCYRKTVRISYKDNVTNEEVRAMFQQALGPHKDLLTIVKWRKLQWYDHVSRLSGLVKTILQGTVKGERRQDRQRKRCEYNIRELTGLEFAKSQRAVENREHGGNWLRNYLWCPNDPRG